MMQDYYKILGVSPDAEAEVITAAYKALMRKYHPDHNRAENSDIRAKELNEAYAVLNSPQKRKEYDEIRSKNESPPPTSPNSQHSSNRSAEPDKAPRHLPDRSGISFAIATFLTAGAMIIGAYLFGNSKGSPAYNDIGNTAYYDEQSVETAGNIQVENNVLSENNYPMSPNSIDPAHSQDQGFIVEKEDFSDPSVAATTLGTTARALNFVRQHFAAISNDETTALSWIQIHYATAVAYYNKNMNDAEIMEDKKSYLKRWPIRKFTINPYDVYTECDQNGYICRVTGTIDFECHDYSRLASSSGISSFALSIDFREKIPVIIEEWGQIQSRR